MIPIAVLEEMVPGQQVAVGRARVERTPRGRWIVWEHTDRQITPKEAWLSVVSARKSHRAQMYISRILARTGTKAQQTTQVA